MIKRTLQIPDRHNAADGSDFSVQVGWGELDTFIIRGGRDGSFQNKSLGVLPGEMMGLVFVSERFSMALV